MHLNFVKLMMSSSSLVGLLVVTLTSIPLLPFFSKVYSSGIIYDFIRLVVADRLISYIDTNHMLIYILVYENTTYNTRLDDLFTDP